MQFIHPTSLAATIDAVDEALFFGRAIPRRDALAAARWLAARQGLPRSYAGMFAPTTRDWRGIRLFTGERIVTRAGLSHVLGEETCRVLRRLAVKDGTVESALARANAGMLERLHQHSGPDRGEYCCGPCSVAMWRHLAAGGLDAAEVRLADGIRRLDAHRNPDGTWRRFPFYYTLLALTEIDGALSLPALRHAAPRCERLLKRRADRSGFSRRRRTLLGRVLDRVGA
jgi:hypothetical protein